MKEKIKNLIVYTDLGNEVFTLKYKFKLPIATGVYGNVFKYDTNSVIKLQRELGSHEQYDVIDEIKNLNLPNFYEIQNILSPDKTGSRRYAGTITRFYPQSKKNIWMIPSEIFVEEVNNLIDSAIVLGKNKIEMVDLNPGNVLITNGGFVIIDIDNYIKRSQKCDNENKEYVSNFLNYLLIYQYFKNPKYDFCSEYKIEQFFADMDLTCEQVQKKILKYKNPLEWFYKEKGL